MTLKVQILQILMRLFIILAGLTMTWFSEKMLISNGCIGGLMPYAIKKSQKVSTQKPVPTFIPLHIYIKVADSMVVLLRRET